jgi:hypothetical protein
MRVLVREIHAKSFKFTKLVFGIRELSGASIREVSILFSPFLLTQQDHYLHAGDLMSMVLTCRSPSKSATKHAKRSSSLRYPFSKMGDLLQGGKS